MRSLFLRIFLWFWLAMAAVVAVLVALSPYWTRSHPAMAEWERAAMERIEHRLDMAAGQLEQGREPARRGPPRGRGRWHPPPVTVVAGDGRVLEGPPPEGLLAVVVAEALRTGETASRREGLHFAVARPAVNVDGEPAVVAMMAGTPHRPPRPLEILSARDHLLQLAAVVVVVGVLCWWLSRWLTSPMGSLRLAARSLAGGDLAVRVDPRVSRRADEIGQLARDFDTMAARLEHQVDAQKQLLRDVSHELRSPLARLGVALELARARAGDGARGHLDRVEREAGRLDELIGRLLSLVRLEAGEHGGEEGPVDLAALVREVVADADYEARAGGRSVTVESPDVLPYHGVAELLRSALENVVRNAVRFTREGTTVEVLLATDGAAAVVTVADRGPGVPAEALESIFEPFARVEDARERGAGGAGLGLSIAARAVRLHGGSITARNRDGGGLVVEIRLPVVV